MSHKYKLQPENTFNSYTNQQVAEADRYTRGQHNVYVQIIK